MRRPRAGLAGVDGAGAGEAAMGLSDIYVAVIYAAFLVVGVTTPFALTLGYVWVDASYPQLISTVVAMIPSSLIMGVAAMVGYIALDRRDPPRFSAFAALALFLAFWVTLTISWAELPDL